jgi:hypothetical protein
LNNICLATLTWAILRVAGTWLLDVQQNWNFF